MEARRNALGVLQRSTSQRQQQDSDSNLTRKASLAAPSLQRTASERAREYAAARLEGTATPDTAVDISRLATPIS